MVGKVGRMGEESKWETQYGGKTEKNQKGMERFIC